MDNQDINKKLKTYNDILDNVKIKIDNMNKKLDKFKVNTPKHNKIKEKCTIFDIFIW